MLCHDESPHVSHPNLYFAISKGQAECYSRHKHHCHSIDHNTGASQHALASETSDEVAQQLIDLNTMAPIKLTRALLPHMLQRWEYAGVSPMEWCSHIRLLAAMVEESEVSLVIFHYIYFLPVIVW